MTDFSIFPLHLIRNGKCGCGTNCGRVGKHPAYPFSTLLVGQQVFGPEGCGYGIATGVRSGVFVVDLDTYKNPDLERSIREKYGDFPETYTVITGNGGKHLYYEMPPFDIGIHAGLLGFIGWDIRGNGGYAVAEGSPHVTGNIYRAAEGEAKIAKAPDWLLSLLKPITLRKSPEKGAVPFKPLEGTALAESVVKARKWLETADLSIQGEGGSTVFFVVCVRLLKEFRLSVEEAKEAILEVYNPRLSDAGTTPWHHDELEHKLQDAAFKSKLDFTLPDGAEEWLKEQLTERVVPKKGKGRTPKKENHVYHFTPGDMVDSDKKKIGISQTLNILLTHPDWENVWQYNEFADIMYATNPPMRLNAEDGYISDTDITVVQSWFEFNGWKVAELQVEKALNLVCKQNTYNPIKEFLEGLKWDGVDRFTNSSLCIFREKHARVDDFLKFLMVAAVRRCYHPGTQVDTCIILQGEQDRKKTSFVRTLFGTDFVKTQMPDLSSKEASLALEGFWCIELGELDRILRTEPSTAKEFLSRTFDDYRKPFAKRTSRNPRKCVFIGTTNEDDFLRDTTGNRRWWPIHVPEEIDLEYVEGIREQLWAQATHLAQDKSFKHWFERKEEEEVEEMRKAFEFSDPWEEPVRDYCAGRKEPVVLSEIYIEKICNGDANELRKADRRTETRLAGILRKLRCSRKRLTIKGEKRHRWILPLELQNAVPSREEVQRREVVEQKKKFNSN